MSDTGTQPLDLTHNWHPRKAIEEVGIDRFRSLVADRTNMARPVVVRGLVRDWPLVRAGAEGFEALRDYLARFDSKTKVKVMRAPPSEGGRFFYREDMRGYNFQVTDATLSQLVSEIGDIRHESNPNYLYAGSNPTLDALPGFDEDNALPLPAIDSQARIWIGNASHVSAHYDLSENIAVVAAGQRRFTLFPPEQAANLYVGPLDVTIAGQPVSMVDMRKPDLARFPRFSEAMDAAETAVLDPGDAIFIPTLWWHQVQASQAINVLVNYWFDAPGASPFSALLHAMLAIRDLPDYQREAWAAWFEHFVFAHAAHGAADHLPAHAKGVTGPPSYERAMAIRDFVIRSFSPRL